MTPTELSKLIPDEVVEAGARAIYFAFTEVNIGDGEDRWERLLPRYRAEYREQVRAAFEAMVGAWQGVRTEWATDWSNRPYNNIILPLTENPDAEA